MGPVGVARSTDDSSCRIMETPDSTRIVSFDYWEHRPGMVIGWVHREQQDGSAWAQVEAAQRDVRLPCLLVPQPAHAVLAGELAGALLPTAFGGLPPEIQRAIQMHDTGWAASDAQQIQRLRSGSGSTAAPVSFIAISPEEAAEAWT